MLRYFKSFILIAILAVSLQGIAQPVPVDKVIAVVGNEVILLSELENQVYQFREQGATDPDLHCQVLEEMLFQNLLIHQAGVDSIIITEEQVEMEMDRRLRFFIAQIGSEKALEEYYGKSINQIKEEFREQVRDQLVVQQMQNTISGTTSVTPAEVRAFYKTFPKDSLPLISQELEVAQILVKPAISPASRKAALDKITELRDRIEKGEKMGTLAVLYSEDPGSSIKRGELGFLGRGTLVPEFEAVAFNLQPGELSQPVLTQFGYHIMELIERRGEQVNIRHILIRPVIGPEDLELAKSRIDSVYRRITTRKDSISFSEAARIYSDDEETKGSGGMLFNQHSGSTRFEADQLDPRVFFIVDKLDVGQVSEPMLTELPDGQQAFRILKLQSRSEPHVANLTDDYQRIQEAALESKKSGEIEKWIRKRVKGTYVRIDSQYDNCTLGEFRTATVQNE